MYGVTNIIFIVFAGLGALLAVIPLPKAIASGNVGTSTLIVWTEVACLVQFINAIRWNRNIENWAPIWCDFCTHFLLVADVALVGSGMSINRRLYMIVTLDPRRHEKVFNVIVDIVLCLVIPLASIAPEYVVQQYRYYIYEDIGCVPGVGNVDLAFPLVWMLPLLMGTVSAGYACLTIRANFQRNHKVIEELGANLAWSRRLMAIGAVIGIYSVVLTSIAIALLGTAFPVTPWPGWTAIHSTIDDVVYVPAQEWQTNSTMIANIELRRWIIPSVAFFVFGFLGLTADVKKMYWISFRSVIDQVFTGQTTTAVTDENLNDHWQDPQSSRLHRNNSCTSFGKPRAERRGESLSLTDRPRLDSDLEIIQVSQPSSPWKPHHEEGVLYMSSS